MGKARQAGRKRAEAGRKQAEAPRTMGEFWACEAGAWHELAGTWRGMTAADLTRAGACGDAWSVKDVWNHLAAWMDATRAALPRLVAGQPLPKGEYHIPSFNGGHYAADRDRPLEASRRRLQRARRAMLACAAELPREVVLDVKGRPGRWVKFATYGHYAEHLEGLRAWGVKRRA